MTDAAGDSKWITGEAARAEVHRLRAGFDAIAVGIGTALADDPSLTVRGGIRPRVRPARVVFDRALRLPLDSRLARTVDEAPVWLVAAPEADAQARSRMEAAGIRVLEAFDLRDGLRALRAAGVRSVFCEGGARLASALLAGHLANRLTVFRAPLLLGPGGTDPFAGIPNAPVSEAHRWTVARSGTFGSDTLLSLDR
jgi:diaminohydroxyphosphoribosylaminopyrimidine deaminase/5-amino-6-(5-phosphoribosylamino)uracil reductase